jgi:hypothetical protein
VQYNDSQWPTAVQTAADTAHYFQVNRHTMFVATMLTVTFGRTPRMTAKRVKFEVIYGEIQQIHLANVVIR